MDGVGAKERTLLSAGAALLTLGSALAWQMPWREYPGQDNIAIPPDSNYVVYSMTHSRAVRRAYFFGFTLGLSSAFKSPSAY